MALLARKVSVRVPACPLAGVPASSPEPVPPAKVIPVGKVPLNNDTVGDGVPDAVTVKVLPAVNTVNVVAFALVIVGATGVADGVTLFDAADAALAPTPLFARTVNVYATPLVRLVTIWLSDVVPALLSTPPAGLEVTV